MAQSAGLSLVSVPQTWSRPELSISRRTWSAGHERCIHTAHAVVNIGACRGGGASGAFHGQVLSLPVKQKREQDPAVIINLDANSIMLEGQPRPST